MEGGEGETVGMVVVGEAMGATGAMVVMAVTAVMAVMAVVAVVTVATVATVEMGLEVEVGVEVGVVEVGVALPLSPSFCRHRRP